MRLTIFIFFFSIIGCTIWGQQIEESRVDTIEGERNLTALHRIKQQVDSDYAAQQLELKQYLQHHKFIMPQPSNPVAVYRLDGMLNGQPLIKKTMNAGSYTSTGAEAVSPRGDFGLDLAGEHLNVIIWDSGVSRRNHQELRGRVNRTDVGAEDDHATHVAGTLLAGGMDSDAKGFLHRATTKTYDFMNDISEMVGELLSQNLQLSNHSYGFLTGWDSGRWWGDASISDREDWRFGFYSSNAQRLDDILYNAPFYCVVRAAGNDRGDSGDGTFPPDGPYDIIGDFGVSKNVFTIGAVNKLSQGYTTREDVVMSSFSSWGPTDDGRIKPDFVAPGVNLYSSLSGSDTDYGLSSGTSMASPSAAGAIGLVNEAFFTFNNRYLKSATLKALLAQTARDAGTAPGPDYSFGWGLIAVDRAVELILEEDGISKQIVESRLNEGATFEIEINPLENTTIKATIAWTDPAGAVPATSLDPSQANLVNDLDIRIVDEAGNQEQPWILNPANPSGVATKGDNFRDNIEQIEFEVNQPKRYFLRVTHKGGLANGFQDFSLVLAYASESAGVQNLYWVNDSGLTNSTMHWAQISGGTPGLVPNENSKLIIDNNSFSTSGSTITLSEDLTINGIIALTSQAFVLDLGGNTLTVQGSSFLDSENYVIRNGRLVFENSNNTKEFTIDLNGTKMENVSLRISDDNASKWSITEATFDIESLTVEGGVLEIAGSRLNVGALGVAGSATLSSTSSSLANISSISLDSDAIIIDDVLTTYSNKVSQSYTYDINNQKLKGQMRLIEATGTISSDNGQIGQILQSGGKLDVVGIIGISQDYINVDEAILNFPSSGTLMIDGNLALASGASIIRSGSGMANIELTSHKLYCFDNITVDGVDLTGQSAVSIGSTSSLTNASGWFSGACQDLLFADFEVLNPCDNALSQFQNNSKGSFDKSTWYVDGVEVSREFSPFFVFKDSISYDIRLEIEDQSGNINTYQNSVQIAPAVLDSNYIIQNSTSLVSFRAADSYAWYKNDELIPNSNSRVYPFDGSKAKYFVVTFKDGCNRVSEIKDFTTSTVSVDTPDGENIGLDVRPVPTRDVINIRLERSDFSKYHVVLYSSTGRAVKDQKNITSQNVSLDVRDLPSGLYILAINNDADILLKKIVIAN